MRTKVDFLSKNQDYSLLIRYDTSFSLIKSNFLLPDFNNLLFSRSFEKFFLCHLLSKGVYIGSSLTIVITYDSIRIQKKDMYLKPLPSFLIKGFYSSDSFLVENLLKRSIQPLQPSAKKKNKTPTNNCMMPNAIIAFWKAFYSSFGKSSGSTFPPNES